MIISRILLYDYHQILEWVLVLYEDTKKEKGGKGSCSDLECHGVGQRGFNLYSDQVMDII